MMCRHLNFVVPVALAVVVLSAMGRTGSSVFASLRPDESVELVRAGKARGVIVADRDQVAVASGIENPNRGEVEAGDALAAVVLAHWIERMTGARLEIVDEAPEGVAAIYVGAAAKRQGLRLDDIDSRSNEGMRIVAEPGRILLAGQNGHSTVRAAARLLEELGCRYLIDHEIGEVYPSTDALGVEALDITEKPGFALRRADGSGWPEETLWKIWNGQGGLDLELGHVWGRYVHRDLFDEHPEYFALRDGERQRGNWFCTSNAELRRVFAQGVIREIEAGNTHPSISPVAGRGYCECEDCRAQDDPDRVEPTSGTVSVSSRYVDFFAEIGQRVGEVHPHSRLSFFIYHDYTLPPREGARLPENVIAWQTPHRYCWLHSYLNDNCPSRIGQREALDGWALVAETFGYRAHNYNYGDLIIPFPRLSTWARQVPDFHERGMIGLSFDNVPNWSVYGPHIWLSLRLSYDPHADAEELLDDYFRSLAGDEAGELLKQYWEKIDRAFVESDGHNTMFYSMHHVYSPELLSELRALMDRAAEKAAAGDAKHAERVAMFERGLRNVEQYFEIRTAMHRGDFTAALEAYEQVMERVESDIEAGLAARATRTYPELFLGRHVRMGAEVTAAPNRVVKVLDDEWRFAYEPEEGGIEAGFGRADFDDSGWKQVRTYSDPLYIQSVEERFTYYWYRTWIKVPADVADPVLFFTEVDRHAAVWVNGERVLDEGPSRQPFVVEPGAAMRPGERNQITVRVDHHRISTRFLGGMIRPVLLIDRRD